VNKEVDKPIQGVNYNRYTYTGQLLHRSGNTVLEPVCLTHHCSLTHKT